MREHAFIISQGTTEKIFEEKKELYDVYIDNQNVKTHRSHLQPLLRLNAADKEKYRKLSEQRYTITQYNYRIFKSDKCTKVLKK